MKWFSFFKEMVLPAFWFFFLMVFLSDNERSELVQNRTSSEIRITKEAARQSLPPGSNLILPINSRFIYNSLHLGGILGEKTN